MDYTKTYNELKSVFSTEKEEILIPGSQIKIHNVRFQSEFSSDGFINKNDYQISENRAFTYPVFSPADPASEKVILLLHGLNERSWLKYLVWAFYLAENTGSHVILFPISFHINRSPLAWKDPRIMIPAMKDRNSSAGEITMSSFANVALSNRLTEDPLRFLNSGYQTAIDITNLLLSVKKGNHPVVPESSNINIFAYSIGAFLGQILMMGNPENLLTDSKLFIFCGGSVFSNMQGSSKLIMDSRAFDKVYSYYLNDFETTIKGKSPFFELIRSSQIGMAFRSMIDLARLKTFRETVFLKLRNQMHSITLIQDKVIPSKGVVATLKSLKKKNSVDVWDFPYTYSHENPFPIFDFPLSQKVDQCFERVFSQAGAFLC